MLFFEKIRVALKYKDDYLRLKKKINQKKSKYLENIFYFKNIKSMSMILIASLSTIYSLYMVKEKLKINGDVILFDFIATILATVSLSVFLLIILKTYRILKYRKEIKLEKQEFEENIKKSSYSEYLILKELMIDIGNVDKNSFDKVELFLNLIDKEDFEVIKQYKKQEIKNYLCDTDIEYKIYQDLIDYFDKVDADIYSKYKKEIDIILKYIDEKNMKVENQDFSLKFYKFKNKILELEKEINLKSINFSKNINNNLKLKEMILKGF